MNVLCGPTSAGLLTIPAISLRALYFTLIASTSSCFSDNTVSNSSAELLLTEYLHTTFKFEASVDTTCCENVRAGQLYT